MRYLADIVTVLVLAAFAGRGVNRGLIRSVEKLAALIGGYLGAHLGASYLKGPVASGIILPWVGARLEQSDAAGVNPVADMTGALAQAGTELERQVMELLKSAGLPAFSFSGSWGKLIDGLTGTGTNIMETASQVIALRIAYVLTFILLFLVIELAVMILFTSIGGLRKLPIAGLADRLGGGAAGLAIGVMALWAVTTVLVLFVPSLTAGGGVLSPEALERTVLAKQVYRMAEQFLRSCF